MGLVTKEAVGVAFFSLYRWMCRDYCRCKVAAFVLTLAPLQAASNVSAKCKVIALLVYYYYATSRLVCFRSNGYQTQCYK